MVNPIEQYKKEPEGGSLMNEKRLEELAHKIKELRKTHPELGIMNTFLYHLPEEDKEGIGEKELGEIMRIIKEEKKKETEAFFASKRRERREKKEKEIFSPEWRKKAIKYTTGIANRDPKD
jgi:hypothetical protein